jgi:Flp pilus assembly pilin Flp
MRRFANRLRDDSRGAALLEYALTLPILLLMLIAGSELGYKAYIRSVLTGVLESAARKAAAGTITGTQIDAFIRDQLVIVASGNDIERAVVIKKLNYYNFSSLGAGEKITGDTAPIGIYNSTDCYEDRNGNGVFDASTGGAAGLGGADDIVFYDVTVTVPRMLPFEGVMALFNPNFDHKNDGKNTEIVGAQTIIRNQPFATQVLITRCS